MTIVLTNDATDLVLHEDLYWEDEFWSPVAQSISTGLKGAPIIQVGMRQHGRPITLRSYDGRSGLLTRADVDMLAAWAAVPDLRLVLQLRGTEHHVSFRHDNGPFDTDPLIYYSDPVDTDLFAATLRFITVPPTE